MKAIEIRNKYLNFFKEHGHEVYVITVSNSKLTQPYEVNGNIIGISSKAIKNLYNYRWASIYPRIAARFLEFRYNSCTNRINNRHFCSSFGKNIFNSNCLYLPYDI